MATLSIFVSFEFDKDENLKSKFYAEAKSETHHRVVNRALNEAYPSNAWKKKAREAIVASDVVVVLIGQDTHNAQGVRVETDMARGRQKPIIQIRPQGSTHTGLKHLNKPIAWHWQTINAKLDAIAPRKR